MTAAARPAGRRWRGSPLAPSWRTGYLLASPALIAMIAILIYPLGYSFVMSFYRWDLSAPSQSFIGLSNYRDMLTNLGLQQSLRVQLVFSVITISIEVAAGIGVAVLVNGRLRGLRLARTLLLVPPMIAPAVVGLNFRWLFNGQYGLVNAVLRFLGLPEAPWLSDPHWALASVMMADIWQNTPLLVLLFLAGLQSLPQDPIEAAKVDGASPWAIFRHITLPLLRPVIMIALMLRIIDTFRTFDVIWLMTQGGPGGATNLITVNAYLLAFQGGAFGHAAAVSYIALFLSLLLLGLLYGVPLARRKLGRGT
ncbi:carbohydrate ABC transporter permease [Inquilinus limosus]|uniref:carbohydrate ABC transporter permease n=1 Tax=Inquilinus limosus TaxID=171674 RepID=UPI0009E034F4|nr:sugar ABC transporter permease [Inquilinus limosus]